MKWKALQAGKTKCIAVHTVHFSHFLKHIAVLKWNKRFCRLPVGFWLLLTGASKCSDKTMSLSKSNISGKAAVSQPCNIFQINTVSCQNCLGWWCECIYDPVPLRTFDLFGIWDRNQCTAGYPSKSLDQVPIAVGIDLQIELHWPIQMDGLKT